MYTLCLVSGFQDTMGSGSGSGRARVCMHRDDSQMGTPPHMGSPSEVGALLSWQQGRKPKSDHSGSSMRSLLFSRMSW